MIRFAAPTLQLSRSKFVACEIVFAAVQHGMDTHCGILGINGVKNAMGIVPHAAKLKLERIVLSGRAVALWHRRKRLDFFVELNQPVVGVLQGLALNVREGLLYLGRTILR